MTQQLTPGPDVLRGYAEVGLTQQQMVDAWEQTSGIRVSRSAMGMALTRHGITGNRRLRARYKELVPWVVRNEHQKCYDLWMLRLEARYRRYESISQSQLNRLRSWRKALRELDAVIMYDPETERGFWWVPRRADDEDIIRLGEGLPTGVRADQGARHKAT